MRPMLVWIATQAVRARVCLYVRVCVCFSVYWCVCICMDHHTGCHLPGGGAVFSGVHLGWHFPIHSSCLVVVQS